MRAREQTADELLSKATELNLQLEAMRQYREESLEYAEIAKRAEKSPRRPLVLCLAAENKQLEQLKMQNRTLEKSLSEHQSALEMIMTKYREQISQLMRTSVVEKALQEKESAVSAVVTASSDRVKDHPSSNGVRQAKALTEERLLMMAAIAQEVAEQSDRYSAELETELQRLETENAGLRDLLAISTKRQQPQKLSGGDARFPTVSPSGFEDSVSPGELSSPSLSVGIGGGGSSGSAGAASVFVEETPDRSEQDIRPDTFGNPQGSNFAEDMPFGIMAQKLTG
ncbi:hypothetical protein AAHC03_09688 [Spirometra sp. Aus1]